MILNNLETKKIESLNDLLYLIFTEYRKIALFCLGNPLRGDDSIGIYVGENLGKCHVISHDEDIIVINGYTVPANFLGKVIEFNPDYVLFIDATQMDRKPGTIAFIEDLTLIESPSMTTHYQGFKPLIDHINMLTHHQPDYGFLGIEVGELITLDQISDRIRVVGNKVLTIIYETILETRKNA